MLPKSTGSTASGPTVASASGISRSRASSRRRPSAPTPGCSPCARRSRRGSSRRRRRRSAGSSTRPDRLMKRFELISDSATGRSRCSGRRSVIRSPPITWIPSWCMSASLAVQTTLPPSIARSCTPSATFMPSATEVSTSRWRIRPVQPGSRWIGVARRAERRSPSSSSRRPSRGRLGRGTSTSGRSARSSPSARACRPFSREQTARRCPRRSPARGGPRRATPGRRRGRRPQK